MATRPDNTPSGVTATGLPTRRAAFTALAGAAAALSLPKADLRLSASAYNTEDHPDATLIAFAATVEALAIRNRAALDHYCQSDGECDRLMLPAKPDMPDVVATFDTSFERSPDGFVFRKIPIVPDPQAVLAAARQKQACDAWEAEYEAVSDRIGVDAANEAHSAAYERLEEAVMELTPMTPTTLAGLAAKARVAVLLDPHDDYGLNDWEDALRAAVLRDIATIEGAA